MMWTNLPKEDKEYYRKLITSFASLSEAFSQKLENKDDEEEVKLNIAPIINSKFQETVFQRSFNAQGEDYGNTSYDASVVVDHKHKYLVGLKSFGVGAGDQKIAQFKKAQAQLGWRKIFNEIAENARGLSTKKEVDKINKQLYLKMAKEISQLRNRRLESSKENLRGFKVESNTNVEAVYHYLMSSKKEDTPKILVGEVPYSEIDINNIYIDGCTSIKKPTNFKFHDGRHSYKYTESDSQLSMTFDKTPLELWEVEYVEDPFVFFSDMGDITKEIEQIEIEDLEKISQTISWKIKLQRVSGFNQFRGLPKNSTKSIQALINSIVKNFYNMDEIKDIIESLEDYRDSYLSMTRDEKYETRSRIVEMSNQLTAHLKSTELENSMKELMMKYLFRSANEIYIPLPNSKKFHNTYPDFFGTGFGKLNGLNFELPLNDRQFKLEFLPSHTIIDAQITQESGKAIQSSGHQDILGKWVLEKVFQLDEFSPLTDDKLVEMEINGIRLIKYSDYDNHVGIEFIWIDDEDLPKDYWE